MYRVHPPSAGKNILVVCGPGNNGTTWQWIITNSMKLTKFPSSNNLNRRRRSRRGPPSRPIWLLPLHLLPQRRQKGALPASQNSTPQSLRPLCTGLYRSPQVSRSRRRRHIRVFLRRSTPRAIPLHHFADGVDICSGSECRCTEFLGYPDRSPQGRTWG